VAQLSCDPSSAFFPSLREAFSVSFSRQDAKGANLLRISDFPTPIRNSDVMEGG